MHETHVDRGSRGIRRAVPFLALACALLAAGCEEPGAEVAGERTALRTETATALDRLVAESPDGVVAFLSDEAGGIVFTDAADGRREFVTRGFSPEWSGHGGTLSFMRDGRIFLLRATDWTELRLPIAPFPFDPPYRVRPVLSPDGNRIAYSRYGGIVVSDPSGTSATYVTPPSADGDRMPAWSPDGSRIAFVRGDDLYLVGADGSAPTNLTEDDAGSADPEWSPDGEWIAYSSERCGRPRIWAIRADGSDRRIVTGDGQDGEERHFHPSWSPDGARIVYERWTPEGRAGVDLYVVSLDGGSVRRLTDTPGYEGRPSWGSPSGIGPGGGTAVSGLERPRRPRA